VPKAAVNEHDKPSFAKNEVRFAEKVLISPPAGDSVRAE
jgi:hypothetical protein